MLHLLITTGFFLLWYAVGYRQGKKSLMPRVVQLEHLLKATNPVCPICNAPYGEPCDAAMHS